MMQAEYPDVVFDGPPRSYDATSRAKRYIAIHDTSNDASDTTEANYGQARTDGTSSHYYVDQDSVTQSLRTEYGAHHAGSATGNRYAIAYEITGFDGWTREQWLYDVDWPKLARQVARDCRKWSIPPVLLTVAQMRAADSRGLVTHDLMRQAWGGTTHTDPGTNFPMDHLIAMVKKELEGSMTTEVDLTFSPRQRPAGIGNKSSGTQLADLWGQEQLGASPVDGAASARTKQLADIAAQAKANGAGLTELKAAVTELKASVDGLSDLNLDALADKLFQRLRDALGTPGTQD